MLLNMHGIEKKSQVEQQRNRYKQITSAFTGYCVRIPASGASKPIRDLCIVHQANVPRHERATKTEDAAEHEPNQSSKKQKYKTRDSWLYSPNMPNR